MNSPISLPDARRSDRRRLIGTCVLAALGTVGLAVALAAQTADPVVVVFVALPVIPGAWLGTRYSYTEVDAWGVRTRGVLGSAGAAWPDTAKIGYLGGGRKRIPGGRRVRIAQRGKGVPALELGVPVDGRRFADLTFDEALRRLQADQIDARKRAAGGKAAAVPRTYRITATPSSGVLFLSCFAAAIAALCLIVTVANMRPSWEAHLGHGVRGTFTDATSVQCGRNGGGCTDYGDFVGADGSDRRAHVLLSAGYRLSFGEKIASIDSGGADNVYPIGGDWTWLQEVVGEFAAALVVGYAGSRAVNGTLRKHREKKIAIVV